MAGGGRLNPQGPKRSGGPTGRAFLDAKRHARGGRRPGKKARSGGFGRLPPAIGPQSRSRAMGVSPAIERERAGAGPLRSCDVPGQARGGWRAFVDELQTRAFRFLRSLMGASSAEHSPVCIGMAGGKWRLKPGRQNLLCSPTPFDRCAPIRAPDRTARTARARRDCAVWRSMIPSPHCPQNSKAPASSGAGAFQSCRRYRRNRLTTCLLE